MKMLTIQIIKILQNINKSEYSVYLIFIFVDIKFVNIEEAFKGYGLVNKISVIMS